MAKTAGKKKAISAHRKVQSSTARSRKNVKRTTNVKKAASTEKKQAKVTQSQKTTQSAKTTQVAQTEQVTQVVQDQKGQTEQTRRVIRIKLTPQAESPEMAEPTTEQEPMHADGVQQAVAQDQEVTQEQEVTQDEKTEQDTQAGQDNDNGSKFDSLIETIIPVPVIDHKAPEIILHSSKRTDLLETKIEQIAEPTALATKGETVVKPLPQNQNDQPEQRATQMGPTQNTTLAQEIIQSERNVEDVLQEVIEKQEQIARTVRADKQSAQELKDSAIEKALVEASRDRSRREKSRPKTRRVHFGFHRIVLALACAAAAVFAIVYFVNLNTPDVSLKVAAMQSGIDAKYPSYVPRDYNLSDITSESGKITLNFCNPTTGDAFTIIEEKSSWDSSTLLANYVRRAFSDDYSQIEEQGLTLFVSGSDATWVNGGVVYKLRTTSGSLTKKQIKSIATSL